MTLLATYFPITDPTLIFFVVLLIILLAPIVMSKLRIPHIIGMVLAGVLIGQYGLNILERDNSFELFGRVGLYYIMFLAGLEMDTMTATQDYDFSLEAYYRKTDHVIDYRDGKSFGSEIEIERLVLPGEGKSYGMELCARKNNGKLTGWLAYTLSWSKTRIDGINGGRWYDASNDRRGSLRLRR